jgi:hypothetical protein
MPTTSILTIPPDFVSTTFYFAGEFFNDIKPIFLIVLAIAIMGLLISTAKGE